MLTSGGNGILVAMINDDFIVAADVTVAVGASQRKHRNIFVRMRLSSRGGFPSDTGTYQRYICVFPFCVGHGTILRDELRIHNAFCV